MQVKIFTIPILGGEAINDEMNAFLRSKKILQVENQLVNHAQGVFWCYSIKYLGDETGRAREKVDYQKVLDEASFKRFSAMREIRRKLAREEGIAAYHILTDEEMAEMARIEDLTPAKMKSIKGIGEKKIEQYGHWFLPKKNDEKSKSPPAADT